tara:strand:+ start:1107 stop:1430 length:324 start_codon:yes stop_codon:yes gene_type:complete
MDKRYTEITIEANDELICCDTLTQELGVCDMFKIHFHHKGNKRNQVRRAFFDDKSKVWITKQNKLAVCCVALDEHSREIVGYRTFTDIFKIESINFKSITQTSQELH